MGTNAMNEEQRLRNRARLCEEASHGIFVLMRRNGVSRAELARRLGKSKALVTKILEGSHNFQLETLADVYLVLGRTIHLCLGTDMHEMRMPVDEADSSDILLLPTQTLRSGQFQVSAAAAGDTQVETAA